MKTKLLFLFLFTTLLCHAQQPWRAKLLVHFETNGVLPPTTDTLWFGCDSLGGEGLQQGLDELDTTYADNKAYFIDNATQAQLGLSSPYNLNTSIRAFNRNDTITFKIKAFGYVHAISWDTSEFLYQQPDFSLNNAYLKCNDCYIHVWEKEEFGIFGRYSDGTTTFGGVDSIDIKQGEYMQLDLVLRFKDTSNVGISEKLDYTTVLKIISNPVYDKIHIQFYQPFIGHFILYDNIGRKIEQSPIHSVNEHIISVKQLVPNVYYLQVMDSNNTPLKPIKIIKL